MVYYNRILIWNPLAFHSNSSDTCATWVAIELLFLYLIDKKKINSKNNFGELVNFKSLLEISQVLGEEEQNRIKAVLYGQCIGDAIGLLTEFLSKEEAKEVLYTIKIGSPMVCG